MILAAVSTAFAEDELQPKANVMAGMQNGYARVLVDWTEKVAGRAQVVDGVVVIGFDQKFDVNTDAVARALEPYVAMVRQDADGRTLRLALKGPVRLKTTDYGTRFAFDLLPPSFGGEPTPPPAPDKEAGRGHQLFVRVSERERTTRLLFDFPGKVEYSAKLADGKLRIGFSKPAKVDLKRFADSPPAWVRGARSELADGKLTLEFDVDREADFHDMSDGDRIVLELREPKTDAVAGVPGATGAPKVLIPESTEDVPPPPAIVQAKVAMLMPPRKGGASQAATQAAEATTPPPDEKKDKEAKEHSKDEGLAANSDATAVRTANAPVEPVEDEGEHAALDPNPLPPGLRLGQSDLESILAPVPEEHPAVPGQARAEIFGSMLRLELPYAELPAAAVFRRGLAVWVVTASPQTMDLSALAALPNAPARVLSTPTQVAPGVTAFRLEAPATKSVSAAAAGNSWVIAVGDTVPDVPAQLQLVRQTKGTTTKLRAYLPGLKQVLWIKDPQTEDRIAVALSYAPARGLSSGRSFVEFAALPSQQGLAVQAIADDLTVGVDGDEAVIGRPSGLNISDAQIALAAVPKPAAIVVPKGVSPAFVDFAAWGAPVAETRAEGVRKLMRLSATSPGGMSVPRMSLARYFIAEGFGAEALGVLANIAREDKTADSNPQFRVARAVANILMARYRDALTDLSMEALGSDPHAAMWRGIAAAGARDWRLARSNLIAAAKIINRYPPAWEARARTALAKAALAFNETSTATQALSGLPRVPLPVDVAAEAKLMRANVEATSGKPELAIALYDELAASSYRPVAARAALEGTLFKSANGMLKPEQAIDALERLRFQWRGDEVELKTLTELGKLYVDNNRIRDGLNTMRLAVRHFQYTDEARATATQMGKIFEALFLDGKADDLPPVQALALFYDFRELTPVGAQGDEMIRKLADRLVTVELLPQAAELLQHQVDQRLEGIAKASVATRLALIYLLDRKAEQALSAIRGTRQTRLPDDLISQRNLIEARALADLKQYDESFDLIAADNSAEANRLRTDILWDAQRWPDAAARTEEILGNRYEDPAPLSNDERMDVMRTCVAYSLAGNTAALERMRSRFEAKMSQTADAKAFAMVTRAPDVTGDDYKNLVKQVASVDTLSAFLEDFRSRYGQGGQTAGDAPAATN